MVEYTPINYVLLSASIVVFAAMFIGCVILVAKEKSRWDRKKRDRRRQYYDHCRQQRLLPAREEAEAPSTVTSPVPSVVVSLRGINEWHLLPPIKDSYRGHTVDRESVGYRSSVA